MKEKLNILSISPKIPYPATDGGKISIYGILKYLSKRGHNIDFVCYRKNDEIEKSIDELNSLSNPHILNVQTENNPIGALKNLFSPVPYNISKYYSKELREFIKDFLLKNKVDVVHISNLHMGWIIDVIKEIDPNIPVVLRQENLEMLIMKRYFENQRSFLLRKYAEIQYKKFIKYEPELCAKFDKCIMITHKDEQRLLEFNSQIETTTIPVGVESGLLNYKKQNEEPYSIAHIGHLDWYPNYDSLNWFINEILPKIKNSYPKVKLYVYGGGEEDNLRIPENLEENIIIKGFVDDIWGEVLSKSIAVVPLRIGSGIRVKILELLAVGQNVITTSIGKEGIEGKDGKEFIVADDADTFANKIRDYFEGDFNSEEMRLNGKKLIKNNYTWEIISGKVENLYFDLINSK